MERPSESPPAPTRTKSAVACERCRTMKLKCIRPPGTPSCVKCAASGSQCILRESTRPLRKKRHRSRISALEAKLDTLMSTVAKSSNNISAGSSENSSIAPDSASPPKFGGAPSTPSTDISVQCDDASSTRIWNLLQQFGLSLQQVEQSMTQYQQMTLYFPFVVLPNNLSAEALLEQRPLLVLAIVAVANPSDTRLQAAIEPILLRLLIDETTINGQKSLHLLSAMLVYVAWHHFFPLTRMRTSIQLINLAMSLCYDLGLHLTPAEAMNHKYGLHVNHYRGKDGVESQPDEYFDREPRRLFVGCYYLSNCMSWVSAKPCGMDYTDHLGDCAASLSFEKEYPTDEAISALIQLQRTTQIYHETLLKSPDLPSDGQDVSYVRAHLEKIENQIQHLWDQLPEVLRNSIVCELAFGMMKMHIHEMGVVNPMGNRTYNAYRKTSEQLYMSKDARSEVLLRCLKGAAEYYENFLTIPVTEYRNLSTVQWFGLIYATVLMYRLTTGLPDIYEWDVQVARAVVSVGSYLERSCERMRLFAESEGLMDTSESSPKSLFHAMNTIWENVRDMYNHLKTLPVHDAANSSPCAHTASLACLDPSRLASVKQDMPLQASGSRTHPCPAYFAWGK